MRADILTTYPAIDPDRVEVIHNGIDTIAWQPDVRTDALDRLGIDPELPTMVFVGRIARQKGVDHALDAAALIDASAQVVLCAGAPDTPEIGAEMRSRAAALAERRGRVVRVEEMLPDQGRAAAMGRRGRQRAVDRFGWPAVAARTVRLYEKVLACR